MTTQAGSSSIGNRGEAAEERFALITPILKPAPAFSETRKQLHLGYATPGEDGMGFDGRTSIIRAMLPDHSNRILDVGCGPLDTKYPFADKAACVTCIDTSPMPLGGLPANVEFLAQDITTMPIEAELYDCVIAADVFEHISLEQESRFVSQCISALKPGGSLILSVPHRGTFAFLDPYQVKPTLHRLLSHLHLYHRLHNGSCDIRKGHKHYTIEELVDKFRPLELVEVVYFGYLFDPLVSWAIALSRGPGKMPGFSLLERARRRELEREYGKRSFNVAACFYKRPISEPS